VGRKERSVVTNSAERKGGKVRSSIRRKGKRKREQDRNFFLYLRRSKKDPLFSWSPQGGEKEKRGAKTLIPLAPRVERAGKKGEGLVHIP